MCSSIRSAQYNWYSKYFFMKFWAKSGNVPQSLSGNEHYYRVKNNFTLFQHKETFCIFSLGYCEMLWASQKLITVNMPVIREPNGKTVGCNLLKSTMHHGDDSEWTTDTVLTATSFSTDSHQKHFSLGAIDQKLLYYYFLNTIVYKNTTSTHTQKNIYIFLYIYIKSYIQWNLALRA